MRRLEVALREHGVGDVADIAVALDLDPGPAFGDVEDAYVVTMERLGGKAGIGPRRLVQVGDGDADTRLMSVHKTHGVHLAAQPGIGEVGPVCVKAGVACGQSVSSCPLAMMTSPRRSTNNAPSTVRFTSTLRLSCSSR